MPYKIFIICMIAVLLFPYYSLASLDEDRIKERIVQAADIWFNPGPTVTMEDMLNSLFQFLDIAGSITTATEYKKDINYRIEVAKELFEEDSIFNEKARQYLSFAYRMMTNGK